MCCGPSNGTNQLIGLKFICPVSFSLFPPPLGFLLLPSPSSRQLRYFHITECWTSLFQALRAIAVLKWGLWKDVKPHILKMCFQVNKFLLSQDSLTFWNLRLCAPDVLFYSSFKQKLHTWLTEQKVSLSEKAPLQRRRWKDIWPLSYFSNCVPCCTRRDLN